MIPCQSGWTTCSLYRQGNYCRSSIVCDIHIRNTRCECERLTRNIYVVLAADVVRLAARWSRASRRVLMPLLAFRYLHGSNIGRSFCLTHCSHRHPAPPPAPSPITVLLLTRYSCLHYCATRRMWDKRQPVIRAIVVMGRSIHLYRWTAHKLAIIETCATCRRSLDVLRIRCLVGCP